MEGGAGAGKGTQAGRGYAIDEGDAVAASSQRSATELAEQPGRTLGELVKGKD